MPSLPIAVSISDILEVRGGPLRESEVWALLCQSAAAIQDFFIKGSSRNKDEIPFVISPNTLTVCRDGQVSVIPGDSIWHGTDFMAPEYNSDAAHALSDTAIEKMFLYTLGKTLQVATEYGLRRNEYVSVSHHLDSLLEAMCEENPAVRIGLRPILEACDLHARQHPDKSPYAQTISRLHSSVLGIVDQTGLDSSYSSDNSRQSSLALRSRRHPRQPHHLHHDRHRSLSRSPSPTHSRSRSRSRSRGRDGADSEVAIDQSTKPHEVDVDNLDSAPGTSISINNTSPSAFTMAASTGLLTTSMTNSSVIPCREAASFQDLNASFVSSEDQTSLYRSAPAYHTVSPMPGMLSLSMGSPAYEKYLQLKERQRRLKAAKTGEQTGVGSAEYGGRTSLPHLMPPPAGVWRGDVIDYMTDARSMASLMSYTLGSYMPELVPLEGHVAPTGPLLAQKDMDGGSLLSSEFSLQDSPAQNFNQPVHGLPEKPNQSHGDAPSRLKRRREDDIRDEKQAGSGTQSPSPPEQSEREAPQQQMSKRPYITPQVQTDESPQSSQQSWEQHQEQQQGLHLLHQFGSRDLTPTPDSMPAREYYGPEFVYRASRPVVRISLPLQGESMKNPALARRVIIVHLTGQKFEAIVDPCMTGRQLFDAVTTHTALDDFFFFGLTYVCDGEHFFLDADTKLHKMAPEGWREGAKGHMPPVTFTLYLRIKFYPDSLSDFRHMSSQHLLYLQLRRDVLEERCVASDQKLLSLSGLALHAEFGDYSHRTMGQNYFVPEQYLPARVSRRLGMGYVHDQALEAHRDALGLAPSQCEIQFIKMVQGLPEYGIHFYKLMKAKNDTNNPVWVGITQTCLLIADQTGSQRTVSRALPWPSILKISFNKRRFSVQPKPDPAVITKGKPCKLNFFTNSYRKGRYLLQLSTAQHRFHIRMRTRAAALETLEGEGLCESEDFQSGTFTVVQPEAEGEDADEEEEEVEVERMHTKPVQHLASPSSPSMDNSVSQDTESMTSPEPEERVEAPPLKYRSPPKYHPNLDNFMEELVSASSSVEAQDKIADVTDDDMHALGNAHLTSEIPVSSLQHEESSQVADLTLSPQHTEFQSDGTSLHYHQQHNDSSDHFEKCGSHLASGQSSLGRHVFEVTLQKEGDKGIGITIVGGETTGSLDLGIFVKSVLKNGPAARTGKICAGDRLIAINGVSLEGVQHHEAVQLIRDSENSVSLLVSQVRAPTTVKRKVNESEDNFDINDDDAVCHSDEEVGVETSYRGHYIPIANTTAASQYHHSHHSPTLHSSHPNHSQSDFVDRGHFKQLRTANDSPSECLRFSDCGSPDSVSTDAKDEILLSEEMLVAAELDTQSYSSGDIIQALDAGEDSDQDIKELEILGDIANMTMDNSDTDSDFDSAVKATVERIAARSSSNNRTTNHVGQVVSRSSQDVVMYEVVLEKKQGSLGILTTGSEGKSEENGRVHIKSLVPGGPADAGGILQPGDCLIEVNSQSVRNATCTEVDKALQSSPEICLLKVARTKSSDQLAMNKPHEQLKKRDDFYSSPPCSPPVLADLSPDELMSQETPISPPSAFASAAATPVKDIPSIPVVSAPPALSLDLLKVEDERSNNTQSDIDSDVLDSSRSELERIYVAAEKYLKDDHDDFDLDAAVAAAATLEGDGAHYRNIVGLHGQVEDGLGHQNRNVSSEKTVENDSPSSVNSVNSVKRLSASPHSKSLIRQDRVMEGMGEGTHIDQDKSSKIQVFTVDLQKSPGGGLGFTVMGGVDTTGGCYIKAVVQDPALSDGRLQPGDRLIQVNGQDMMGLNHFEAVTFLRQTPKEVSIKVWRYPNGPPAFVNPPHETKEENGLPTNVQHVKNAGKQGDCQSEKPTRHAKPDERTSESVMDQQQHQYDCAREEDDPNLSMRDLVKCLDTPKAIIRPYAYSQEDSQAGVLRIMLCKPQLSDSLGFSLVQRRLEGQSGIFIKTLTPGGIAHSDGQLRVGDRLLQVNGVSLIGCSHTKAIRLLKEASGNVVLTVSRSCEGWSIGEVERFIEPGTPRNLDRDTADNPPVDSVSNSTDDFTDDDINDILDEAMNFLDDPRNAELRTPTPTSMKQNVCNERTSPQIVEKTEQLSMASSLLSGNSKSTNVNKEDSGLESRTSDQTKGMTGTFPGYVRKVASLKIAEKLTEKMFLSLPVLSMGKRMDERSMQLLQSLADAVEKEEPMLEFQKLRQLKATDNMEVAKLVKNKTRNRYRNVLPYDFNRVKLHTLGEDENDYINASDIQLGVNGDEQYLCYIACQGPLAATIDQFWQMVWEIKTNVVTMLTQEVESGKAKCQRYWPESCEEPLHLCEGKFYVQLIKEQKCEYFDVRHLMLGNTDCGEEREIIHMHYNTWPDHGVPDTAFPLLRFVQLMHQFHSSGPFVVHCSAGIGRSGVLIAVDTALARIENGDELDLFDIVTEMRRQRYGMIQTQDQYLFCYTACMEALLSLEN